MTENAPVFETHDVLNQPPPMGDVNLYEADAVMRDAVAREGGGDASKALSAYGEVAGSRRSRELARLANTHTPVLRAYDEAGRRLDMVEFHPAYHELMRISTSHGVHCLSWEHLRDGSKPKPGRNVARAGLIYMAQQMEPGHSCPITMTNAVVPALQNQPDVAAAWLPRLLVRDYDPDFVPAEQKSAVTIGMGMTEKQGGTDVRANQTTATPVDGGGPGADYIITGHKWFFSAPMCDAFLILAQAPGGLSCFLLPRFRPDGTVNPLRLQRLKEKLGNRANASSEVEFHGCHGVLVGEEGRGVRTIIDMVTYTRLDCAVASGGLMRQALAAVFHHVSHRTVFQKKLADQPLMRQVLADMALDHEAAVALTFRLARAFDRSDDDMGEAAYARCMTAASKYAVCKMTPPFVYEAMECMGGNGFVEDGVLARLYREAPLNAIWEGSGNVMCLDVLRVLEKSPDSAAAVLDDLEAQASGETTLAAEVASLKDALAGGAIAEQGARRFVERLATCAAACLLRASAPAAIGDAYIASRLAGGWRATYGMLEGADTDAILTRAGLEN